MATNHSPHKMGVKCGGVINHLLFSAAQEHALAEWKRFRNSGIDAVYTHETHTILNMSYVYNKTKIMCAWCHDVRTVCEGMWIRSGLAVNKISGHRNMHTTFWWHPRCPMWWICSQILGDFFGEIRYQRLSMAQLWQVLAYIETCIGIHTKMVELFHTIVTQTYRIVIDVVQRRMFRSFVSWRHNDAEGWRTKQ